MSSYARTHAKTLATLRAKGAALPCTLETPATEAMDGTRTPGSTVTVDGYAVQDDGGDPARYAALGLSLANAPRVLFCAVTYGAVPSVGMRCTWGGEPRTVRDVEPYGPDGVAIYSYLILTA